MDQNLFNAADRHLDQIAELLDKVLPSPELQKLREGLVALGKALGNRFVVSLNFQIEVFDQEKERILPLLSMGLATSNGEEPYRVAGDSTPLRYLVDGEIQVVSHDHCPKCWKVWDFKMQNRSCRHCGAELGQHVKLLLDSDICPNCEKGQVTAKRPKCSKCGFEVDPAFVAWG